MRQYELIDSDTHMIYPPNMWEKWLSKKFQDRAPKLVKDQSGEGDAWRMDPDLPPEPLGLTFAAGKRYEDMKWSGSTYDDIRPGAYDGPERLKDMDFDGVDAGVVYSDNRTIGQVLGFKNKDQQLALIQAYNDWLLQEFCATDTARLVGLTQIPNCGIEASVSELKRCAKLGARGILLRNYPSGGTFLTPEDDPFWQACIEENMPIGIHIGFSSGVSGVASFNRKAHAAGGAGSMGRIIPIITDMIYEGLFDRYPELRVSAVETGSGWLPYILEQLDTLYWRNRTWSGIELQHLPSRYWFSNWSITFVEDQYGVKNRHSIGVDNMMWSTDYPHNGCDWPYSRKVMGTMFTDVPADEMKKMTCDNCGTWYGLLG